MFETELWRGLALAPELALEVDKPEFGSMVVRTKWGRRRLQMQQGS